MSFLKRQQWRIVLAALLLIPVLSLMVISFGQATETEAAGASYQPVEWQTYTGGARYKLSYLGLVRGCKPDEPGNWDHKYKINLSSKVDPERLRIYSNNFFTQLVFKNKSPMGANLSNPSQAYLCIGQRDNWKLGPLWISDSLYVWAK